MMSRCPVCETETTTGLCPACGFDSSLNYERHPTLGWLNVVPAAISRRRVMWEEEQARTDGRSRCRVCGKFVLRDPCPTCGFDRTMDYERYPTLGPLPPSLDAISRRSEGWDRAEGLRKGLWQCPVCGKYAEGLLCPRCGFDGSRDAERYPTLGPIPAGARSIDRQRMLYPLRPIQSLLCPRCGGSAFTICFEDPEGSCQCARCGKTLSREQLRDQRNRYTAGRLELTGKRITDIAAGYNHTVALYSDGTVRAIGNNDFGQCNTRSWTGVRQIAALQNNTYGLRTDGTVLAAGDHLDGQCRTGRWKDIDTILAGYQHIFGLRRDGTVVMAGKADKQLNVNEWTNITSVASGYWHVVGLRADGTVTATGSNYNGQCSTQNWRDVTAIFVNSSTTFGVTAKGEILITGETNKPNHQVGHWQGVVDLKLNYFTTYGLTKEGTVYIAGEKTPAMDGIESWKDIASIHLLGSGLAGLRKDGTAVISGSRSWNAQEWTDLVSIHPAGSGLVGLRTDGTLVYTEQDNYGQRDLEALIHV